MVNHFWKCWHVKSKVLGTWGVVLEGKPPSPTPSLDEVLKTDTPHWKPFQGLHSKVSDNNKQQMSWRDTDSSSSHLNYVKGEKNQTKKKCDQVGKLSMIWKKKIFQVSNDCTRAPKKIFLKTNHFHFYKKEIKWNSPWTTARPTGRSSNMRWLNLKNFLKEVDTSK